MTTNIKSLNKKREIFREQIQRGEYKSIAEIILDGIGEFIQNVMHSTRPITYLSSGLLIVLVVLLISILVSLLANEFHALTESDAIWMALWAISLGYFSIVGFYSVVSQVFNTISESVLDSIQSVKDLESLQEWSGSTSRIQRQLIYILGFTILMSGFLFLVQWKSLGSHYPLFGLSVIAIATFIQIGLAISCLPPLSGLIVRLETYKLKLYMVDPASSEVIEQLSHSLNKTTLFGAELVATVTFGFVFFKFVQQQIMLSLILFAWALFVTRFLLQQITFTKIISRAKRAKLNDIQAQIEMLETGHNLANKDTLEIINHLMDYHDRIKNTPSSAINIRSGLNF